MELEGLRYNEFMYRRTEFAETACARMHTLLSYLTWNRIYMSMITVLAALNLQYSQPLARPKQTFLWH
jgi:hypothetical protein